jgi:hypothetical protein
MRQLVQHLMLHLLLQYCWKELTVKTRASVPITDYEASVAAALEQADSAEHEAAQMLAPDAVLPTSKAAAYALLMRIGARAVREQAAAAGYAAYAATLTAEDVDYCEAARSRRDRRLEGAG